MNFKYYFLLLMGFSVTSHGQIPVLIHKKEIGLYQTNKSTQFIKDVEVLSPKSADFIDNKLVINALEKGSTIIYDVNSWNKLPSIVHQFNQPAFVSIDGFKSQLSSQAFLGKPVEMTNNHQKLWIPYYRLSWDTASRHPSAIAQIDRASMQVEKLLPAGSIPKMVKVSHDNKILASTNWGENTVGLYRFKQDSIESYKEVIIERKLNLQSVGGDRDKNCGFCLRGTVFTPDDKYLLVGRMGGGGIAVVDVDNNQYLGTIYNVPPTPRHLVLSKDGKTLYISTVASGEVARINLDKIYQDIENFKAKKKSTITLSDWSSIKTGSGVRTIALSKDEKYIYAAMNSTSELGVIDLQTMKMKEKYKVASFPVGLAVSDDDKYIAVTSQGKEGRGGGNHVDIFERN